MEDKELQELFAAKSTVEANRHRQEKLAEMITGQPTTKSRRWPLWATSIAAGIAVLLMTMPQLFRSNSTEEPMLAQTQEMAVIEKPKIQMNDFSTPSMTSKTSITRKTSETIKTSEAITPPDLPAPQAEEPMPTIEKPPATTEEPVAAPQKQQKRIHRRTSTRMVNSDNTAPAPKVNYRKAIADAICKEESNTITLHTIELS